MSMKLNLHQLEAHKQAVGADRVEIRIGQTGLIFLDFMKGSEFVDVDTCLYYNDSRPDLWQYAADGRRLVRG